MHTVSFISLSLSLCVCTCVCVRYVFCAPSQPLPARQATSPSAPARYSRHQLALWQIPRNCRGQSVIVGRPVAQSTVIIHLIRVFAKVFEEDGLDFGEGARCHSILTV
jgi:hypothetical protein